MTDVMGTFLGLFGALIQLGIVGLVLYFIFRKKGEGEKHAASWDTYFYIASFLSLMVLYWAVADLARIILERVWDVNAVNVYSYPGLPASPESQLRDVSLRMSAIVVAPPIFVFHWFKAAYKQKEGFDWLTRRGYAVLVMVISGLTVLVAGIWFIYQGFNLILGVADADVRKQLAMALPYTLGALTLWIWHWRVWQEAGRALTGPENNK